MQRQKKSILLKFVRISKRAGNSCWKGTKQLPGSLRKPIVLHSGCAKHVFSPKLHTHIERVSHKSRKQGAKDRRELTKAIVWQQRMCLSMWREEARKETVSKLSQSCPKTGPKQSHSCPKLALSCPKLVLVWLPNRCHSRNVSYSQSSIWQM